MHLICFTTWSTFKGREVLGASDGHPLRWNWKGCKYFGEVQIKRNWTSPDGVGCHQDGGRGVRPNVGSNPPLSQLGFSKVCQGEDRRFGAGCQPSSYSTAFHLLGKQFYISLKSVWYLYNLINPVNFGHAIGISKAWIFVEDFYWKWQTLRLMQKMIL